MVFATVPAAPPTAKNHRATSWPPPISAKVPYFAGSRLSATAFCRVLEAASSMMERPENRRQHPATPSRRLSTPVLPEVRVGERPSAGVELSRFAVAGHSSTPADLTTRLTAHSAHRARRYGAREAPLEHQGEHYTIPYRGPGATGLGKPLRSILHGRQIPIYIAAIAPKSIEQAAEIADGWLPVWYSPYRTKFYREALAAGFRRAGGGKSLASFDVAPGVTVIQGDDVQACLDFVKPMLALYIGGMGARGKNFYNELACRYGFEAAAKKVQDLYLDGKKAEATAAVPNELADEVSLVGPPARIRDRLAAWREAGATTLICGTRQVEAMRTLVEAGG